MLTNKELPKFAGPPNGIVINRHYFIAVKLSFSGVIQITFRLQNDFDTNQVDGLHFAAAILLIVLFCDNTAAEVLIWHHWTILQTISVSYWCLLVKYFIGSLTFALNFSNQHQNLIKNWV